MIKPSTPLPVLNRRPRRGLGRRLHRALVAKGSDLLPPIDFIAMLIAASLSLALYAWLLGPLGMDRPGESALHRLVWITALLAPFMLYDPQFAAVVSAGRRTAMRLRFGARQLMFLCVLAVILFAARWLDGLPWQAMVLWLLSMLSLTLLARELMANFIQGTGPPGRIAANASPGRIDTGTTDPSVRAAGNTGPAQTLRHVGEGLPVTVIADRPIRRWSALAKASLDAGMALTLSLLLLPMLLLIALAIRLDSPGPVVFRQRRHGVNNAEFSIYKFRTMRMPAVTQARGLQQTVRGDPRITRVGAFLRKWSLDELPQVFNVLEGSMSLVGPRPHAVDMRTETRLGHEITAVYPHRHRVKPGITGWSQINGARGATDTVAQLRRRIELDLYYIEHWSPLLDLKILSRTFKEVLRATNAF